MKQIKIASAGIWHTHAKDFANRVEGIDGCQIEAVFDFDTKKVRAWADELQVKCYTDYADLLKDPEIDGIMVTCETTNHADLICRAAGAGKHIYVEKALCSNMNDAERIRQAVHSAEDKYGIHFVMSDPVQKGAVLAAKDLIDSGKLGRIVLVRSKSGHDFALKDPELVKRYQTPSESGGGVMLDMGHHAVHILLFLLGMPVSVSGFCESVNEYAKLTGVEDFASFSYQYADGAVGIAQGSLITPGFANGLEVIGTKGYLHYEQSGSMFVAIDGEKPYEILKENLPLGWSKPLNYWLESIRDDMPCDIYGVDEACDIVKMITAGYESKGKAIKI